MSVTDELRRMLDERGIEHYDHDHSDVRVTEWANGGRRDARYEEWSSGTVRFDASNVTAEQAIAATLPHAASTHAALIRESEARMALQSDYNNQVKRIQNQRKQLREMQAALERGTCHTVSMDCFGNPPYNQSGLSGNDPACGCSECGAPWSITGLFRGYKLSHNFKACPICGRKVVG